MTDQMVGPSDEELNTLWNCCGIADDYGHHEGNIFEYARAVLTRWGSTPPRPVPVTERLPGPEDCNAEGRCWFSPWHQQGYAPSWRLIEPYLRHFSDAWWLPAHAIPTPQENIDV